MNKPYQVYENFLEEEYFNDLYKLFTGYHNPWYYQPRSADMDGTFDFDFMFAHKIYDHKTGIHSPLWNDLQKLILKVGITAGKTNVMRAKANLYTVQSEKQIHQKHTDYPVEAETGYKTAVFNFNTCDGGTIFYVDGKEDFIPSIANSVVIFDGPTEHAGVTQTNSNIRCLLNLDYNDGEFLGEY